MKHILLLVILTSAIAHSNAQIINGGFEDGNILGWVEASNNCGTVSSSLTASNSGSYCAYICAEKGSLIQTVTLSENDKYTITFYTKWDQVPSSQMRFQITLKDDIDNIIAESIIDADVNTWVKNTVEFAMLAGTSEVNLSWITDNTGCRLYLDDVFFGTNTGLSDKLTRKPTIYPNPSSDGIFNVNSTKQIQRYEIYNSNGQLIRKVSVPNLNNITIILTEAVVGLYILNLTYEDNKVEKLKIKVF